MASGKLGPSSRPIVAVIGSTGVGKSQLAVSLAKSLELASSLIAGPSRLPDRGVVLSADSMQLYKGLDVITNKVTREEMQGVEHWGLDIVTPGEGGSWELGRWCSEADYEISSLPESCLPIICGGTHYFIQHFLFPPAEMSFDRTREREQPASTRWVPPGPTPTIPSDLPPDMDRLLDTFWMNDPIWPNENQSERTNSGTDGLQGPTSAGPSRPTTTEDRHLLSLHRLLESLDPDEAQRWHWRDGRKVRRALERWWERGVSQQNGGSGEEVNSSDEGRRSRFRTLIFWVYEPLDSLAPRLDVRVDVMLEKGLLGEIAELRKTAQRMYGSWEATDHTEGIYQSIGYKEFAGLSLSDGDPTSHPEFPAMLARTKTRTRQYARSQLRWIRKQLLPVIQEAQRLGGEVALYVMPGGSAGEKPAQSILKKFLNSEELPDPHTTGSPYAGEILRDLGLAEKMVVPDTIARQSINSRRVCDTCSTTELPVSVGQKEWDKHLKSKQHRRAVFAANGGPERLIAEQKAQGSAKRAERLAIRQDVHSARSGENDVT